MPTESGRSMFQRLGAFVQEELERLHVPGVAVGVFHGGEEYTAGFGVTSVENPLPVTPDTFFQIGSITKTFTATAAMRLVEAGKLDLDRPIRAYLPNLQLADETVAERVTLRHVFTHTGGWFGDYFDDLGAGDDALAKMVGKLVTVPQLTPLGQLYSYNNAGFYLAGRVIEVVTGTPYEAVIKQLVLDPLRLERSFFSPSEVMTYRFAIGHAVNDGKPVVQRPWPLGRALNPAGGIAATARDQLTYARFHLSNGTTPDGTRLLTSSSLEHMQRAAVSIGGDRAVGVAWHLNQVGGISTVSHGGGTLGQVSLLVLAPDRGFALSILTNAFPGGELAHNVEAWAYEQYLGVVEPEPVPLRLSSDELTPYLGHYAQPGQDLDLTRRDGDVILQLTMKQGFPKRDSPIGPPPPPTRLVFVANDGVIALDPPFKGPCGEFVRDSDGSIGWLRFGGRLARRADR